MRSHRPIIIFLFVSVLMTLIAAEAMAAKSAVIFMYHRFGETDYPTTNITIEQFEAHITELKNGGYTVMALPDIIAALVEGRDLPDRAVALTVDDAYLSVYTQAWPRFKSAGFPFTLFVATDPVDQNIGGYMNWSQIRELRDDGVTIGSQTASHLHMPLADIATNRHELEKSNSRFIEHLGQAPTIIAYPYGEAGLDVMTVAREAGFIAGLGQHSGVAAVDQQGGGLFYLPRFALNENYGDIARFSLAANALSLPATDVTPADPLINSGDENPPAFGFTVIGDAALARSLRQLNCFALYEGKIEVMVLGGETDAPDGNNMVEARIEIRMLTPLPKGRTRINCTVPAPDGRWRWFGRQFLVK